MRFSRMESKIGEQSVKQDMVEQSLLDLTPGVSDNRRKLTLVIGSFERDTRKAVILLEDVDKMLKEIDVKFLLDESPFVTGPRRSTALLPFRIRQGEGFPNAKARLHRVLNSIVKAKLKVPHGGKTFWAGVSKNPAERELSGHCSWVRNLRRSINVEHLDNLDKRIEQISR